MTKALRTSIAIVFALAMAASLAIAAGPAAAQTAPPSGPQINTGERPNYGIMASSDAELLRALQGARGAVTIPDRKAGILIQPQGRGWRETMLGPIHGAGLWLIFGVLAVATLFFLMRGRIMIEGRKTGRLIERFSDFERFSHWLLASSFIVLALTGLNISYGRYVLLPILGGDLFTAITLGGKYAHDFMAFAFIVGLVLVFLQWVAHNIPTGDDLQWLAAGGGLFTKGAHPPSRKFNAGQKIVFWSVVAGGAVLSYTGVLMLFPFYFGDIFDQQLMAVLHAIVSAILVAVVVGHIYIGTLGMEGAWETMSTGMVDEQWAREHHNLWLDEVKGQGTGKAATAAGHD